MQIATSHKRVSYLKLLAYISNMCIRFLKNCVNGQFVMMHTFAVVDVVAVVKPVTSVGGPTLVGCLGLISG